MLYLEGTELAKSEGCRGQYDVPKPELSRVTIVSFDRGLMDNRYAARFEPMRVIDAPERAVRDEAGVARLDSGGRSELLQRLAAHESVSCFSRAVQCLRALFDVGAF